MVGVSDGDTITVLHNGVVERIWLHGTDTPEKRQAFGKRAIQFTSTLIFGKTVPVQVVDHAHLNQVIAPNCRPAPAVGSADAADAG